MQIRRATAADREAILALVPRLAECGTPAGRDRQQIEHVDLRTVAAALTAPAPDSAILVAEAPAGVLGFIHVRTVVDYYTQSPIGHVSDVVLDAQAQGQGVDEALLKAAQDWASARGYRLMQLFVLPENDGARRLYERMGYRTEWLKYIRPLP